MIRTGFSPYVTPPGLGQKVNVRTFGGTPKVSGQPHDRDDFNDDDDNADSVDLTPPDTTPANSRTHSVSPGIYREARELLEKDLENFGS